MIYIKGEYVIVHPFLIYIEYFKALDRLVILLLRAMNNKVLIMTKNILLLVLGIIAAFVIITVLWRLLRWLAYILIIVLVVALIYKLLFGKD